MLAEHAATARHPEVVRVQVALLKLCEGKLDKLQRAITEAHGDYRDVLAWAEYPAQMRAPVSGVTKGQMNSFVYGDLLQYEDWLRAHIIGAS